MIRKTRPFIGRVAPLLVVPLLISNYLSIYLLQSSSSFFNSYCSLQLWFPLFSVLPHTHSDEVAGYDQSTLHRQAIRNYLVAEFKFEVINRECCESIKFGIFLSNTNGYGFCSLEEFIQTSSIGEFRKRLLLIFAFLGQFVIGRSLEAYSR